MSNFIVSARKYRPLRFEDVVGQQHVAGTLKNALATDHVAHAFLFCGPRGVGKTTCARILAKVLNCQNRTADFEPCDECSSCKAFRENASFNIIELDGASNNSVEHIRALIEQVRFQPQQGKYKVFIIDEVHMLSNQAFNAFLKTLEEPPPYAIFILATTEKHKIIPTILSRCQIFDFRRISVRDMVLHLQGICEKEGIEAEEDALHIIAQKADGALRDALSIFDRITSFSGKSIRYADVIENLNVLDYDYYFQITDGLLAGDMPGVLHLFDQILRKGFEPDVFINGLAEHLRNILVCRDAVTLSLLEVGDTLRDRYRKQAALAPPSFLLTALNLCNDCDINYKMARHKRLHVEMALIKMSHVTQAVQAATIAAGTEKKTPERSLESRKQAASAKHDTESSDRPEAPEPAASAPGGSTEQGTGARTATVASNAQELSRDELSGLASEVRQGLRKTEKISLRLKAFEEAVAVEEAERSARESRLNMPNAEKAWKDYQQKVESPTLLQALQAAALRLDGFTLVATVGLTVHKSLLLEESNRLLDYLRNDLHDTQVKLQVVIDETRAAMLQAETEVKRPLTTKEKFEKMRVVNPLVYDLVQRFDLKPED